MTRLPDKAPVGVTLRLKAPEVGLLAGAVRRGEEAVVGSMGGEEDVGHEAGLQGMLLCMTNLSEGALVETLPVQLTKRNWGRGRRSRCSDGRGGGFCHCPGAKPCRCR